MEIQPYSTGRIATKVAVAWGAKLFYSENLKLIVNLMDGNDMILETREIDMTVEQYAGHGTTKEQRLANILSENGITLLTNNQTNNNE